MTRRSGSLRTRMRAPTRLRGCTGAPTAGFRTAALAGARRVLPTNCLSRAPASKRVRENTRILHVLLSRAEALST
jgi:hypothetical protein